MKTIKLLLFLCFSFFTCNIIYAQNWLLKGNNGTNPTKNFIGTKDSVSFTIKANNKKSGYIDVDYTKANTSFGYLSLSSNIYSYNTAFGYKAMLYDSTGGYNTAIGQAALYFNITGDFNTAAGLSSLFHNTTGNSNTAVGGQTMYYNTTGIYNTAIGMNCLFNNTEGNNNTASGINALFDNTTGNNNTAMGLDALLYNKIGYSNVAVGVEALSKNVAGHNLVAIGDSALYNSNEDSAGSSANTAVGSKALYATTTGLLNTATGFQSLYLNSGGDGNTALGAYALNKSKTGNYNTALGYNAGPLVTKGSYDNTTAVGFNAIPTASNQVRVGNTSVTSIGGQVGWTNFSDERIKSNIKENVPGLAFINLLRPVTYHFNTAKENELLGIKSNDDKTANADIEKINFTGFLAQEVDKAAQTINYDFSGVDKSGSIMGLRYSDFVVPLVKAVQELSTENDALKKNYDDKINALQKQVEDLKAMIVSGQSMPVPVNMEANSQQSTVISSASLSQNIPNPFTNSTTINYILPKTFSSAQIIITDQDGKALKQINVNATGKGILTVDASTLASGAYSYSLIIDGKFIDTKRMILNK